MEREKAIQNLFRKNGISYSLNFIRLNYETEQYEYKVDLLRGESSFSFPFSTGIGWNKVLKEPKEALKYFPFGRPARHLVEELCKNPLKAYMLNLKNTNTRKVYEEILNPKFRIEPSIVDIIFSLMMDYWTWEDSIDFEEFCENLGFDPDSRKALAQYLELEKMAGKVYRFFSEKEVSILTKLTENY